MPSSSRGLSSPQIPIPCRSKTGLGMINPEPEWKSASGTVASLFGHKGSAFRTQAGVSTNAIVQLISRVKSLREKMEPNLFRSVFVKTLSERLSPQDLKRMLQCLQQEGLKVSLESKMATRGRPGSLTVPNSEDWATGSGPRRSQRLSPRTPVLASALVNLTKQFSRTAASTNGEFQIPQSPANSSRSVNKGSNASTTQIIQMKRPPPLGIPSLSLGERSLRRSPRRSPRFHASAPSSDDDVAHSQPKNKFPGLSDTYPSPVPLSSPRRFGMPRVAVIRKNTNLGKRKRKMTKKGLAHSRKRKTSRSPPRRQPPPRTGMGSDMPMSPGRRYLLRNFVSPVSPLLRSHTSR